MRTLINSVDEDINDLDRFGIFKELCVTCDKNLAEELLITVKILYIQVRSLPLTLIL